MLRVSDCAGPVGDSRVTSSTVLPSASSNNVGALDGLISQLNTGPACTPVNASPAALRRPTHDSGPGWLAGPFLYDSFIRDQEFLPRSRTDGRPVVREIRADQIGEEIL